MQIKRLLSEQIWIMSETTSIIKLIDQLIIGADNMEIKWQVQAGQQRSFKQFLLGQGISQRATQN